MPHRTAPPLSEVIRGLFLFRQFPHPQWNSEDAGAEAGGQGPRELDLPIPALGSAVLPQISQITLRQAGDQHRLRAIR